MREKWGVEYKDKGSEHKEMFESVWLQLGKGLKTNQFIVNQNFDLSLEVFITRLQQPVVKTQESPVIFVNAHCES